MSTPDQAIAAKDDGVKTVQIHQYIQLVNQNSKFPDATTINQYDAETRQWILRRTELEQEERIKLINKITDYDHEINRLNATETGRSQRFSQAMAFLFMASFIGVAGFLIYHNKNIEGLLIGLGPLGLLIGTAIYQHFHKNSADKN